MTDPAVLLFRNHGRRNLRTGFLLGVCASAVIYLVVVLISHW